VPHPPRAPNINPPPGGGAAGGANIVPPPAPPPSTAPPSTAPPVPPPPPSAPLLPPLSFSPYAGATTHFTRFLALDKCLPRRDFLQLVTIPRPASEEEGSGEAQQTGSESSSSGSGSSSGGGGKNGGGHNTGFRAVKLRYDCEWLAVMRNTHGEKKSCVGLSCLALLLFFFVSHL